MNILKILKNLKNTEFKILKTNPGFVAAISVVKYSVTLTRYRPTP